MYILYKISVIFSYIYTTKTGPKLSIMVIKIDILKCLILTSYTDHTQCPVQTYC